MSDAVAVQENGAGGSPLGQPAPVLGKSSDIEIVIKRNKHRIEVDMDKLTWKDGKALRKYQASIASGEIDEEQAIALMDGIIEKVTGQHPDTMPVEVVNKVVRVLFADDADAAAAEKN